MQLMSCKRYLQINTARSTPLLLAPDFWPHFIGLIDRKIFQLDGGQLVIVRTSMQMALFVSVDTLNR